MEMLVTKFSKGKYRNESDLFAEPISSQNVKLMGEMIALQALRTIKKFDMKIADKLYIGLIKDLHHMSEIDYIVSDGYDVAQTAICFLYQFKGRIVHEIYGKDCKGKDISIKLACYREVDHFISLLRNRPDRNGKIEYIDFADYKALPMDPVNCFEQEQTDYTKYDELVGALQLSALELAILNCYMNGMVQSEVCAELGIGRGKINTRKASIRQRYKTLLVIAHRLSTIQNAHQIVVLKEGNVEATGTQAELLEHCALYRDMWSAHIGAKNWAVSQ